MFSAVNPSPPQSVAALAQTLPSANEQQPSALSPRGPVYKADYDYEAEEDNEITFQEGDHISDIEIINDGWCFGTNIQTGERGMIPTNYITEVIQGL